MTAPSITPWQVLERRLLVDSTHVKVWEDRVRLGNGREIDDFCVIESPDWAAVLCITVEGQVALVRQYRHGLGGESWELPAGTLEASEEPLSAAKRELLEETGYASEDWRPLLLASVDPSRQTARAHFYTAVNARRVAAPRLDASEELLTVLVSKAEVMSLIESGRLMHGLHIAAISMAARRGLL